MNSSLMKPYKPMDKAFWLKTRDVVRAAATPTTFKNIVEVLQRSTTEAVEQPVKAVEELSNHLNFNGGETESILKHFMQETDFSRWGLANAVTRTAEDVADYDRASELEEAGWKTFDATPTRVATGGSSGLTPPHFQNQSSIQTGDVDPFYIACSMGENMRQHLDPDDWAEERGTIFSLYRDLDITDEGERHRLQHAVTGCSSLRYMTREEHKKLIETLENLINKSADEQTRTLDGLFALSSFDYREVG